MTSKKPPREQRFAVSLARQPIFDDERRLWGYELFCVGRAGDTPSGLPCDDGVAVSVASSAYVGLQQIVAQQKRVTVSFSEKSILDNQPYALPPERTAVQVSEEVFGRQGVAERLAQLKSDGYMLEMRGFSGSADCKDLYRMADIISLDVAGRSASELAGSAEAAGQYGAMLLALRVDDAGVFKACAELGFALFQGAFFKSPEVITLRKLGSNQMARFSLFKIIETDDPNPQELAETIQSDASISFRLLAYLNSAAFGFSQKIKSIQHAIAMLGWRRIKNWLRVVLLSDVSQGAEASELLLLAAQRGKFLELVAKEHDFWGFDPESLHLLGLFSLLDTMMGAPMPEIVSYLPLDDKLKAALCREPNNEYLPLLSLAQYFEEARWGEAEALMQQLNLDGAATRAAFQEAVDWTAELSAMYEAGAAER